MIPLLIILLGIASVTLLAILDSSVWMLLLGLLLGLASTACIIACPIMYFLEKKRRNTALANSPEYCNAVAQIQHENARIAQTEQARLDSQYNDALTRYNTEVIPSYNKTVSLHKAEYSSMLANHNQEKKEWERERAETLRILEEDATKNEEALKNLYDSTNIISAHYREIPILEWLYDDMSTSDHDIRYATELLDRHRQRIATEEAKERTAHAIDGLSEAMKSGMNEIIQLQGIQIGGIQRMGAIASDILDANEDIFAVSKKILFHERVNTADIVARNYRRARAQKAR